MYSQPKRIEFLDSLRGLAALFVLFSHTLGAFAWPAAYVAVAKWPFINILSSGSAAVAMFFILSGYVLSNPYVETGLVPGRKLFLPTFYLRRFLRIWLPWFAAFIASLLARKFLFFQPATQPAVSTWLDAFWHAPLTITDFFRQCAFVQPDPSRRLIVQDWSLGVELKGSALIPLFLLCARRKYLTLIFVLAALCLIFVGTGYFYVSFIIGVLLAQYGAGWAARLARLKRRFRILIFAGGLLLYQGLDLAWYLFQSRPATYKCGWVVTSLGCGLILNSVFGARPLQRMLNWSPVVFLGRISYSVYLLQLITIECLLPPLLALLNHWGITQTPVLFPVTFLASTAVTIGGAAVMYRLVELPVIDLGHRLTAKIQRRFQK
jgi:peptidoglycan/LPS O-acetylase OafA/YrhL